MFDLPIWFTITIALIPALFFFLYISRLKENTLLAFILGGGCWFIALIARLPLIQLPIIFYGENFSSNLLYLSYTSLLAGFFEENIRYFCIKKIHFVRKDLKHVLSLGLGWGFIEAFLLYGLNVIALLILNMESLTFMQLLPGALERNFAIIFHSIISIIIYYALFSKALLFLSILLHTILNLSAILILLYTENVWFTEAIIFIFVIFVVFIYLIIYRKFQNQVSKNLL